MSLAQTKNITKGSMETRMKKASSGHHLQGMDWTIPEPGHRRSLRGGGRRYRRRRLISGTDPWAKALIPLHREATVLPSLCPSDVEGVFLTAPLGFSPADLSPYSPILKFTCPPAHHPSAYLPPSSFVPSSPVSSSPAPQLTCSLAHLFPSSPSYPVPAGPAPHGPH